MGVALFSCKTEEPEIYSCDGTVNEWAKENLDNIRTMTRKQWNNLDEDRKRAAYVAFTPEQKIALWNDKIEQVLTLDWSEEERKHIIKVSAFINSHHDLFHKEKITEALENELESFANKWKEEAVKDFGWNERLVYSIIASPNNLLDKDGNIEVVKDAE